MTLFTKFSPPPINHNRNENICLKYSSLEYSLFFLFVISFTFSILCARPTHTLTSTLYLIRNLHFAVSSLLFWWVFSIISVLSHCLRKPNLFSVILNLHDVHVLSFLMLLNSTVSSPVIVKCLKGHISKCFI